MAPGILNRRVVDDLPELGLLDETGSQYDDISVESNSNPFFTCCGKCSRCMCDCCCFNCPKKKVQDNKKDDDFDNRTNTDPNKSSLDSMFQTMDRRDFIMENIRIEYSMSRKPSGALSVQRHSMQPTELQMDIDDESVLSSTDSQEDITDVPEPLPDTPVTAPSAAAAASAAATRTPSGSQSIIRKCVTAVATASGFCKIEDERTADVFNSRCDICPYDFIDGDEICSSMNDVCPHKFHKECIIEWLMDHDHCPCCNQDFLVATKREEDDDESIPSIRNISLGHGQEDDDDDVFDPLERNSWNIDSTVSLRRRRASQLQNMDSVRF